MDQKEDGTPMGVDQLEKRRSVRHHDKYPSFGGGEDFSFVFS